MECVSWGSEFSIFSCSSYFYVMQISIFLFLVELFFLEDSTASQFRNIFEENLLIVSHLLMPQVNFSC